MDATIQQVFIHESAQSEVTQPLVPVKQLDMVTLQDLTKIAVQ
jgi:hypothetical protein